MSLLLAWSALALAALGHGLLWTGAVNRLHGLSGPRRLTKALTMLCVGLFAALPLVVAGQVRSGDPASVDPFAMQGWARWYFLPCAAIGAAALVVKPWIERLRYDRTALVDWTRERRDPPPETRDGLLVGAFSRLLGTLPGNEATALSIDRKRLSLPHLPAELEGLTIVHLSDLHMTGRVGREYFVHLVREVNALRPDVIAITGDIIERRDCRPWLAPVLGQLCAPLGVYFVLGNHDEFIDADLTRSQLQDAGLICLSGRWLRAEWNGAPVRLGGNELPWLPPAASLADLPPRSPENAEFRIALCHTPDQLRWCQRAGIDLALAGHTHGGQVQLPWLGVITSPSLHGTRYACGVFRRGRTVMHVTRGVGGETPLRWRCPPEAALLELTRGALNV